VDLSIVIPTFRRPAGLRRCIQSCLTQTALDGLNCEVVIVDNCPEKSARDLVASIARAEIIYTHEPCPGVAQARNRGIAVARAPLIALIDDDEVAERDWIRHLLLAQAKSDADVVFGTVSAVIEENSSADPDFVRDFYSVNVQKRRQPVCCSGNALLRAERCFRGGHRFDPQLGSFGGEDRLFFLQLARTGVSMVWCPEAVTHEIVPFGRTTHAHIFKRCIVLGQHTSLVYSMLRPPEWRSVAWFMLRGALQCLCFGVAAACAAPISPRRAMRAASQALFGLGKVFWMSPFRIINRYGLSSTVEIPYDGTTLTPAADHS
jgi:succinoglycan biosynthesis protein ExoM